MPPSARLSSQERRSAILQTAIQLFSERGFRGVTTRELAQAIGVSEPILYQHFPSKKDLYAAIIETAMDSGYYEALNGLKAVAETTNDEEFFRYIANAMMHWFETRPQYLKLKLFSALEGHELMDQFNDKAGRPFIEIITGYIGRRVSEGAFTQVNPLAAALSFCGMVNDYCMSNILFRAQHFVVDRETMVNQIIQLFLNGIRNKHS
jgi:AcrR family transcriptional regulator